MILYPIEAGNFKLDGGAMFGVVPKPLWERTNPADGKNRIEMATRSLLVEDGNRLILIDTGMGNKQDEKFFSHYDLFGGFSLEGSLAAAGFHQDDITDVFFTHLHFDHCGGAIQRSKSGVLEPAFKNARFWVHESHWKWAINPNPREKASFLQENILPIQESGQLNFILGDGPLLENTDFPFSILLVDGHTEKQMLPLLDYKGKKVFYAADLVPTAGHIPIPYVMGYDVRPLLTMSEKIRFLEQALLEDAFLFLEHDPYHQLVALGKTEKGIRMNAHFSFDSCFNS
ncbi:MAG: glyoxylase-like metal-dependent hydrolase (beta-lactamase superfamily II) [Flavobacteriaceae bacterium]|jgi:glyoxylase-like metal-dependent hydrolase (beta-lactamase superfamily II)|tara:strand:+ start:5411 stop:6268 length:858 start_codon:yes stop_codon:yes gene_type:complete